MPLHGRTRMLSSRAPVLVRRQSRKTLANGRDQGCSECANDAPGHRLDSDSSMFALLAHSLGVGFSNMVAASEKPVAGPRHSPAPPLYGWATQRIPELRGPALYELRGKLYINCECNERPAGSAGGGPCRVNGSCEPLSDPELAIRKPLKWVKKPIDCARLRQKAAVTRLFGPPSIGAPSYTLLLTLLLPVNGTVRHLRCVGSTSS